MHEYLKPDDSLLPTVQPLNLTFHHKKLETLFNDHLKDLKKSSLLTVEQIVLASVLADRYCTEITKINAGQLAKSGYRPAD